MARAKELMFLGSRFSAQEALRVRHLRYDKSTDFTSSPDGFNQ